MQQYKRVLFPIDFSEDSIRALDDVITICQENNSELFILYAYRLIDSIQGRENTSRVSLKREIDRYAADQFSQLERNVLCNSGVKYSFLSEVGFLNDRILFNAKSLNVDLIVIGAKMQERMHEKSISSEAEFVDKLTCPVMLIPATAN